MLKILKNFFFLAITQVLNHVLPLIMAGLFIEKLGFSLYGQYLFFIGILVNFSILINYSFIWNGTAEIVENSNLENKLDNTIKLFFSLRIILFIITILSFNFFCALYDFKLDVERGNLIVCGNIYLIGSLFYSDWIFHGLEKFKQLFYTFFFSKLFFLLLSYFILNSLRSDKLTLLIYVDCTTWFICGLVSFLFVFDIRKLRFVQFDNLFLKLKEGLPIFISSLSVGLFTTLNIFIIGLFSSKSDVVNFNIPEKIIFVIGGIVALVNRSIYPSLSKSYNHNIEEYKLKTVYYFRTIFLLLLSFSVIIYFVVPYISIFLPVFSHEMAEIFRILILVLFFSQQNAILSIFLIISKINNKVMQTNLFIGVIHILLGSLLTKFYGGIGLSYSLVLVLFIGYVLLLHHNNFFNKTVLKKIIKIN